MLHLHPALAPFKAAVLPLSKKLAPKAEEIYAQIDKANGFETELRAQLGEIPEEYRNMQIGCSIGIATTLHNDASLDVQELINEADKVLYEVKNEAKGTYRFLE